MLPQEKRESFYSGTAVTNDRIALEERLYFCWHAPPNICDASEALAKSHENKLRMDELLHLPLTQLPVITKQMGKSVQAQS